MGERSKKQQMELNIEFAKMARCLDKIKEMMRKDPVAKKKFELLDNVASDALLYCCPDVQKGVDKYNEMMKGQD